MRNICFVFWQGKETRSTCYSFGKTRKQLHGCQVLHFRADAKHDTVPVNPFQ